MPAQRATRASAAPLSALHARRAPAKRAWRSYRHTHDTPHTRMAPKRKAPVGVGNSGSLNVNGNVGTLNCIGKVVLGDAPLAFVKALKQSASPGPHQHAAGGGCCDDVTCEAVDEDGDDEGERRGG